MKKNYDGNYKKGEIEILNTKVIYNDDYFTYLLDEVLFPDFSFGNYTRIINSRGGGVAILPINLSHEICLLETFRHAIRSWSLEIPRGFIEKHETPEVAALRELSEELGVTVNKLEYLGSMYADNGIIDTEVKIYIARDIEGINNTGYSKEAIRKVVNLPIEKVKKLISDNYIKDSFTICALTKACLINKI